jgi:hypothetical protein
MGNDGKYKVFSVVPWCTSGMTPTIISLTVPGFSGKWAPYYYTITTWQKLSTAPAIYNLVGAVGVGTSDGSTFSGCQSNP